MRLLLDECCGHRSLRDALIVAGHDVARSVDALGTGVDDLNVFAFACEQQRITITKNNADFIALSENHPKHPGILLIYQDNKPGDMRYADIVQAISRVETTYPSGILGVILPLNNFLW